MELLLSSIISAVILLAVLVAMGFNVLREYERAVIFRFGSWRAVLSAGMAPASWLSFHLLISSCA